MLLLKNGVEAKGAKTREIIYSSLSLNHVIFSLSLVGKLDYQYFKNSSLHKARNRNPTLI